MKCAPEIQAAIHCAAFDGKHKTTIWSPGTTNKAKQTAHNLECAI